MFIHHKISLLSLLVPLTYSVPIRVLSSPFLEFKWRQDYWSSGKEKGKTGKEQQCGQKPWKSAGSAENRRALRKVIRIGAVTKPENDIIFAEVLIVFILKDHETIFIFF